jgi:hypothetical protein
MNNNCYCHCKSFNESQYSAAIVLMRFVLIFSIRSKVFAPTIVAATTLALQGCGHHHEPNSEPTNTVFEKSVMDHFGLVNFTSIRIPLEAFGLVDQLQASLVSTNSTEKNAVEAASHPHFANSDMYYNPGETNSSFVREVYNFTATKKPIDAKNREFNIVYPPDLKEGQKVGYILNIQCGGMCSVEEKCSQRKFSGTKRDARRNFVMGYKILEEILILGLNCSNSKRF